MSVLHLKQNVIVKVVVTEKFKEDYRKELERQLAAAEGKARELKSSIARLVIESAGVGSATYVESLKAKIEEERMLQEAIASELRERIKEVQNLEVDSLFPYTVLEGLVELKEGDDLIRKISGGEIIIKDGIVISIKNE